MKNATMSVKTMLLLGAALWALGSSHAFAQTDDAPADGDDAADTTPDAPDAPPADGDDVAAAQDDAAQDAEEAEAVEEADEDGEAWIDDGHDEIAPPEPAEEPATEPEPSETETASELGAPAAEEEAEATEEAAEEAAEEEEAPSGPEPLPWRNTFFSWTNQVTFNSFLRDAQLSYNPTYQQVFTLTPRWYIAPTTFFWASATLSLELTDSDGDALNRDPQITDTLVDLRHLVPWEGFVFIFAGRLGFPTSKASQVVQRYLQTGLTLTAVRPISEAGLTLAGVFSYRRWWAGSNVAQVGEEQPDRCPTPPPAVQAGGDAVPQLNTTGCDQLGTASSARDILLYGLNVVFTPPGFSEFNVSLSAFFFTTYGHELAPYYAEVDTSPEPILIEDGSPSHWNNFTYFALSVGYQFAPWLNVSVGIQNSGVVASAYNPDGSIRNPLFTPDTQVFLTGTFQLDAIYGELQGGEDNLTPEERQRRRQGLASGPTTGGTF